MQVPSHQILTRGRIRILRDILGPTLTILPIRDQAKRSLEWRIRAIEVARRHPITTGFRTRRPVANYNGSGSGSDTDSRQLSRETVRNRPTDSAHPGNIEPGEASPEGS